jgi:hypothetical protein
VGVKPFGVFSYKARVSPHAEVGYEVNGGSTLAGNNLVPSGSATVAKGSLPNRFLYIVGADVVITKRLTGAFDIYGQRLFSAPEFVSQPYKDYGNCSGAPYIRPERLIRTLPRKLRMSISPTRLWASSFALSANWCSQVTSC